MGPLLIVGELQEEESLAATQHELHSDNGVSGLQAVENEATFRSEPIAEFAQPLGLPRVRSQRDTCSALPSSGFERDEGVDGGSVGAAVDEAHLATEFLVELSTQSSEVAQEFPAVDLAVRQRWAPADDGT